MKLGRRGSMNTSGGSNNSSSSSSRVRVAVRVRPPDCRIPKDETRPPCVAPSPQSTVAVDCQHDSQTKTFTFDHVFGSDATQEEVYMTSLQPLMTQLLDGYNVTVIAYGQTGSGKTYTVGNRAAVLSTTPTTSPSRATRRTSLPGSQIPPPEVRSYRGASEDGLIPRFLSDLFASLKKEPSLRTIRVSFVEIYCDTLRDLLEDRPGSHDKQLTIREDTQSGWVENLRQMEVESLTKALELMNLGRSRQVVGTNALNDQSSRSHVVYTMEIKRKFRNETKTSKLTFVDLAGSERIKKSQVEGTRMKESIQINVGLSALGNVINALADDRLVQRRCSQENGAASSKGPLSPRRASRDTHVPYRSSKLTRLLRDALGGNSRTLFIACVSPLDSNADETYHTLVYANRARNIQNKVEKNVESEKESAALQRSASQLEIERLQEQLQRLQQLIEDLTSTGHGDALPPLLQPLLRDCRDVAVDTETLAPTVTVAETAVEALSSTSVKRIPRSRTVETSSQCESTSSTEASTETCGVPLVSIETQVAMEPSAPSAERLDSQSRVLDATASQNPSPNTLIAATSVQVQATTTSQSIGVHAEPSTTDEQCSTDVVASRDAATDCEDLFPIESQPEELLKRQWTGEPQDDSPSMKPEIARIKHLNRAFLEWNSSAAIPVFPMRLASEDPQELTPKKKSPSLSSPDPLAADESNDENQEDVRIATPKRVVTFVSDPPSETSTTRSLSLSLSRPLTLHDAYDDTEYHNDDDSLPSQLFIPPLSSPEAHDSPLSVCASTLEETDLLPALAVSVKRLQDCPVESDDDTKQENDETEKQTSNQQQTRKEDDDDVEDASKEKRDYIHEPLPRLQPISGIIPYFQRKALRPMSLFRLDDQLTDQLTTKAELLAKRLRKMRKQELGESSPSNQDDDDEEIVDRATSRPLDSLLRETNAFLLQEARREQQVRVLRQRLDRLHEVLELAPSTDRLDDFVKPTQIALLNARVVELEALVARRVRARCVARREANRWPQVDRSVFLSDEQCRACALGLEDAAAFRSCVLPLVLDGWISVSQHALHAEELWLRL